MEIEGQRYYSTRAVGKRLGLTPRTVQRYIVEGRIKAIRPGRSFRVLGAEVLRFESARCVTELELAGNN